MQALYRKYRSQKFGDIVGQGPISKTLSNAVKHKRVGHAYIFSGPRGTGKTSMARILAKAVNCINAKNGEPCNRCLVCNDILRGSAVDIIEIDAASHTGIEDVRNIIEKMNFAPVNFEKKVYIIDEVHMLSKSAFNALLKTLEEPPAHVLFILATTEIQKIPITILSRCQRFDFKLGETDEIVGYLRSVADSEKVKISDSALSYIADIGNGSYRDAITAFDQILSTQSIVKDKIITESEVRQFLGIPDVEKIKLFVDFVLNQNIKQSFNVIDEIVKEGLSIKYFSACILENLRLKMRRIIEKNDAIQIPVNSLLLMIKIFTDADRSISVSSIPQLPLEMAVLEFAGIECKDKLNKDIAGNCDDLLADNSSCKKLQQMSAQKKDNKGKIIKKDIDDELEISFDQVKEKWGEIMLKVKPHNGHLFAFLSKSRLDKITGDRLHIKVPYGFYKERITDRRSQKILNNIFLEILGVKLRVCCVVGKPVVGEEPMKGEAGALANDAMDVFVEDVV